MRSRSGLSPTWPAAARCLLSCGERSSPGPRLSPSSHLLPQSRGSLFAVPVATAVYLLVVPGRLRAAAALTTVAVTVLLARGPLLDLFQRVRGDHDPGGAIHSVLTTIGISVAAVLVVWTIVAAIDGRMELTRRQVRAANAAALGLLAAALVAGAIIVATSTPGPGDRLGNSWRSFKAGYPTQTAGTHFALGLGSNRYDFWRVALLEFRRHPLAGVGVDNFAESYVRDRRSREEPLYPHSLELGVLEQTGIVGGLLFAGFVVAAGIAVLRGVGRGTDLAGGAARAGVVAALYVAIPAPGTGSGSSQPLPQPPSHGSASPPPGPRPRRPPHRGRTASCLWRYPWARSRWLPHSSSHGSLSSTRNARSGSGSDIPGALLPASTVRGG